MTFASLESGELCLLWQTTSYAFPEKDDLEIH